MQKGNTFFSDKYVGLTDEEIIDKIKQNDEIALAYMMDKYKDLINVKVGKYFIIGADREDICQEGMIGLYKATQSFNKDKNITFKSFANMCIERQLITAIKSSNRQKHSPLNSYLSLNGSAYYNEDGTNCEELIDIFRTSNDQDPLETIMKEEYYSNIYKTIDEHLSPFEKSVLGKYIDGVPYVDIAEQLGSPVKSVDNAIQRIRKKANKKMSDALLS